MCTAPHHPASSGGSSHCVAARGDKDHSSCVSSQCSAISLCRQRPSKVSSQRKMRLGLDESSPPKSCLPRGKVRPVVSSPPSQRRGWPPASNSSPVPRPPCVFLPLRATRGADMRCLLCTGHSLAGWSGKREEGRALSHLSPVTALVTWAPGHLGADPLSRGKGTFGTW